MSLGEKKISSPFVVGGCSRFLEQRSFFALDDSIQFDLHSFNDK